MKKFAMLLIIMVILVSGTGCTNNGKSPGQGDNHPNNGVTSERNTSHPGAGNQADSAYNLDDLIAAVTQAGCISGEAQTLDVKAIGAEKCLIYGNVAFLQYDPSSSKAYFDAYDANKVTIGGKTVNIGAINGPYFIVFLDGNVDQKAVKAFLSIGFGN